MSLRQLRALCTMGLALVRKLLLMPFVRNRGATPWLRRLRQESLTSTPAHAWQHASLAGRCLGCGLCDLMATAGFTPSATIMAAGRRPEDAPLACVQAQALMQAASDIARICPARMGVTELAQMISDNAALLEAE